MSATSSDAGRNEPPGKSTLRQSFFRMSDPLKLRLKHLLVETLKLDDLPAEKIPDDEPLIGSGLNLDSIDALELVVRLEKEFGVKIASSEEARLALGSVNQLAAFIRARAGAARLAFLNAPAAARPRLHREPVFRQSARAP